MKQPTALFVGGRRISGGGREERDIVDPAAGNKIGRLTCANAEDLEAAADSAAQALPHWASTPAAERAEVLRQVADGVREAKNPIAALITAEMGKPLDEAKTELDGVAGVFDYFSDILKAADRPADVLSDGLRRVVELHPVGPVLVLNTWNFPVEAVSTPLVPALAAGCSAVVLANPVAPSSVIAFFELLEKVDLPRGTVNLLTGHGPEISSNLIADPRIAHVAYTGSVSVGRELAAQAGRAIKRATLELGGNAPAMVLPGADARLAARSFAQKKFWNTGQVCTAPNRIYVHRSLYEEFLDGFVDYSQNLRVGPGSHPDTTVGPLATRARQNAMVRIAEDAEAHGARKIYCGSIPDGTGFFHPPTVYADVPDDALGMREEIFGPIACITAFDEVDSAVQRANRGNLGLSAYVYGPDDLAEARAVADRLNVGSVGVNQMVTAFTDTPFGGVKESGLGAVGGAQAIKEFQKFKLLGMKA